MFFMIDVLTTEPPGRGGKQFKWNKDCEKSFYDAERMECLCNAPVLAHQNFANGFILDTDASDYGFGAVHLKF